MDRNSNMRGGDNWAVIEKEVRKLWSILDLIKDNEGNVQRCEYCKMNMKLQKALRDDYNAEDAIACALEDWEADSKGKTRMDYLMFEDSIVELLAVWADATGRSHFNLLDTVLHAITQTADQDGNRLFKPTEEIKQLEWAKTAKGLERRSSSLSQESELNRGSNACEDRANINDAIGIDETKNKPNKYCHNTRQQDVLSKRMSEHKKKECTNKKNVHGSRQGSAMEPLLNERRSSDRAKMRRKREATRTMASTVPLLPKTLHRGLQPQHGRRSQQLHHGATEFGTVVSSQQMNMDLQTPRDVYCHRKLKGKTRPKRNSSHSDTDLEEAPTVPHSNNNSETTEWVPESRISETARSCMLANSWKHTTMDTSSWKCINMHESMPHHNNDHAKHVSITQAGETNEVLKTVLNCAASEAFDLPREYACQAEAWKSSYRTHSSVGGWVSQNTTVRDQCHDDCDMSPAAYDYCGGWPPCRPFTDLCHQRSIHASVSPVGRTLSSYGHSHPTRRASVSGQTRVYQSKRSYKSSNSNCFFGSRGTSRTMFGTLRDSSDLSMLPLDTTWSQLPGSTWKMLPGGHISPGLEFPELPCSSLRVPQRCGSVALISHHSSSLMGSAA